MKETPHRAIIETIGTTKGPVNIHSALYVGHFGQDRATHNFEAKIRLPEKRSILDKISLMIDTAEITTEETKWEEETKKYCAIITLDVKNAFNSSQWKKIHETWQTQKAPSYIGRMMSENLKDRIDTENGTETCQVTGGGTHAWN